MADGRKKYETRHWPAPSWLIGQPYAIHAAMKVDKEACYEFGYSPLTIPRGCIVSIHILVQCVQFTEDNIQMIEDDYGDFSPGRFGWESALLHTLSSPVKVKGWQGLWNWPYKWKDGQLIQEGN